MDLHLDQKNYRVKVYLKESIFQYLESRIAFCAVFTSEGIGGNAVMIKHCQFARNSGLSIRLYLLTEYKPQQGNIVSIENCQFFDYNNTKHEIIIFATRGPDIYFNHCTFYHNKNITAFRIVPQYTEFVKISQLNWQYLTVVIANTTFSSSTLLSNKDSGFISVKMVNLHLIGPVVFHNLTYNSSIIELEGAKLTCSNYIEISQTRGEAIIRYIYSVSVTVNISSNIFITQNTYINISSNNFTIFIVNGVSKPGTLLENRMYSPCYFQYLSDAILDNNTSKGNYSVVFNSNFEKFGEKYAYKDLPLIHCSWLSETAFNTAMPLMVNKKYIKYISRLGVFDMLPSHIRQKTLCYCVNNTDYDCNKELLDDPIYAGQTMKLSVYTKPSRFSTSTVITVLDNSNWLVPSACVISNISELAHISKTGTCNTMLFTITFHEGYKWCELFLKATLGGSDKTDIYYITESPCPAGFIKIDSMCQCYPFLTQFGITCDINDQTILRPENTWILPIPQNNTFAFRVSLNCPFHFCLPYSSHLELSTPNSQCQFNRSGILCGHCQRGLSTVFSSFHCQQCSNIYLFLIVPITIAGLVLVLLLFNLNLTVTDGTINAFILYVNIISINTPIFFPQINEFTPTYTFMSLANLDLGIQTCFYNGMDDYAKMWLQLAFPFYLTFIATLLIIASRYSTKIQRLTARRALPVLATLFLLSYTKVLHIVSSVLFSYSTVIHLPSKHTSLVWSIDANVSLIGTKFAILFIVCLVLFLFLLSFNVLLLFTRPLSRFNFVTKFKPILDAYQGSYKDKFYYWTGIQLVIRVIFYGISSLDRNINLTIGIMLLTFITGLEGVLRPFKIKYKTYQELVLMFNLQFLFVISLYNQYSTFHCFVNIMISLAAVHLFSIVTYHVFYYLCGEAIRDRITSTVFIQWLTNSVNRQNVQQQEIQEIPLHNIPEVAFNYCEYLEPLIGVD